LSFALSCIKPVITSKIKKRLLPRIGVFANINRLPVQIAVIRLLLAASAFAKRFVRYDRCSALMHWANANSGKTGLNMALPWMRMALKKPQK
jgi:hypothetical protein